MENYDLIVIGLGPAGLRAVKRGLSAGLSVLAFEKETVGGTCLNKGCVPTKSILHSSDLYNKIKNSNKFGINIDENIIVDFKKVMENKNSIVQKLSKAIYSELIGSNLNIIKENARIDFEKRVVNDKYYGENIIIATGSSPYELKNLPFNHKNIFSSDDILNLEELPKSIAIIGSGAIGIEWARIFSNFGVETSIVEKAESLLPLFDIDIQKRVNRILKMKKVKIYTSKTAISYKEGKLILDDNTKIEADKVLVAVGRKRNLIEGLEINPDLTTNYKNIYVSGDISSSKMLAHCASMQADYVMDKITNTKSELTPEFLIPSIIYGTPEIASIGIREDDIENTGEYKIHNILISYLAKSWCDGETDGFIKIITKDNLIKGAHIVSSEASSVLSQIQILMNKKVTTDEIKKMVFAHPTYSEGVYEAIANG